MQEYQNNMQHTSNKNIGEKEKTNTGKIIIVSDVFEVVLIILHFIMLYMDDTVEKKTKIFSPSVGDIIKNFMSGVVK